MASLYGTEGQDPGLNDPLAKSLIKLLEKNHPDTATTTSVSAATSATSLKAENNSRKGLTVYNDSSASLYLGSSSSMTTSAFIVKMAAGDYYEFPFGYVGAVYGLWSSATGAARVTEFS